MYEDNSNANNANNDQTPYVLEGIPAIHEPGELFLVTMEQLRIENERLRADYELHIARLKTQTLEAERGLDVIQGCIDNALKMIFDSRESDAHVAQIRGQQHHEQEMARLELERAKIALEFHSAGLLSPFDDVQTVPTSSIESAINNASIQG